MQEIKATHEIQVTLYIKPINTSSLKMPGFNKK